MLEYLYGKRFGSKIAWANQKEGDRVGLGSSRETGCGGQWPTEAMGAYVKEIRHMLGWATGWFGSNYCVLGGCLLFLILCRRGFQDLLKVRPSSLLMLYGCICSSIASLMIRSMYPVLAERGFVPCSLIMWSWLMPCSATADLSVCASLICLLCSLIWIWMDQLLCPI
jgi:hypothetical protein